MAKTNLPNKEQKTNKRSDPFFIKATKKRPAPKSDSSLQSSSAELDGNRQPGRDVFRKRSDPFFTKVTGKRPIYNSRSNSKRKSDDRLEPSSSTDLEANEQPKKKPFDKQKWRQQKYSLKSKVEQWQNKRVEHLRHEYNKEKSRTRPVNFDVQKIYEEEGDAGSEEAASMESENGKRRRRSNKSAADDGKPSKEELLRIKAEKEQAKEQYRKKMIEKRRILNKKTKKGQPIMKGRMELLLKQIQENMNS